jgi:alanine-synthesizing transaminase
MFSARTEVGLEPNALTRALEARRRSGQPVVDLTLSNPTLAGISYPEAEIAAALADPRSARYAPEPLGLPSAREGVSRHFASRGIEVGPNRILLTSSTSEAYSYLFKLLCDPGDEVLVPRPSYPLFEHLARFEGVRLRSYSLAYDGAWHIDIDALFRAKTERSRAVLVVSPNNPTGSFLSPDELTAFERLGLPLIADEVFAGYTMAHASRCPASALEASGILVFSLGGLSKLIGLPQLKLAWTAVSGPAADAAMRRLEIVADAYLSPGAPVQLALPRLLELGLPVREAILERVRRNYASLRALARASAASPLHLEGG